MTLNWSAHIKDVEVPGLELLGLLLPVAVGLLLGLRRLLRLVRVVAGGLVEVAVAAVDVEARQLPDLGERIGELRAHGAGEVEVDRHEVVEAAPALERL